MVRIDNFAGNVVATMTEARVVKNRSAVQGGAGKFEKPDGGSPHAWHRPQGDQDRRKSSPSIRDSETERGADRPQCEVDRLANARTILTDEAIGQLGQSVTETLTKMRGCASNIGQMQPHRTLGDNAAESQDTIGWPLKWPHTVKMSGGRSIDAFPHHYSESDLISASLTDLTGNSRRWASDSSGSHVRLGSFTSFIPHRQHSPGSVLSSGRNSACE